MNGGGLITKIHANLVYQVYLVSEVFKEERECKEMVAVSHLVLQACISLLRCFRQKWRFLFLPCSPTPLLIYIYK